jgi:hypothetical protein
MRTRICAGTHIRFHIDLQFSDLIAVDQNTVSILILKNPFGCFPVVIY